MKLQALRKRFEPLLRRGLHLYWRFARGMTLGVRGIVVDGDDRCFSSSTAMSRAGICPAAVSNPVRACSTRCGGSWRRRDASRCWANRSWSAMFFNSHVSRRDHVAVYLIRNFRQNRSPEPNREIVACGFFEAGALPAETTAGTRLRISEALQGKRQIGTWR